MSIKYNFHIAMDQMNDNDSDSDPPDIDSLAGYSTSDDSSLWSLSNRTCTFTDEDNTSSLTTNSSIEDLSSILNSSNQDSPSIHSSSSVQGVFSDFEPSINNDLSNEHLDSNNITKSLKSVFKIEEQEVDKKKQSQSNLDFIDSNKLTEDTQMSHNFTSPRIRNSGKHPQSILRNSSTIESGKDTEMTNVINPPVFDKHPNDSEKKYKTSNAAALIDSNKLLGEPDTSARLQKLVEHYYELNGISTILDETPFESYGDALKKLKTSLTREFTKNDLLSLDDFVAKVKIIPKLSKFLKDTYDGDFSKAVSDIIGPLGNYLNPSLRDMVVANLHASKSLSTMGDGK